MHVKDNDLILQQLADLSLDGVFFSETLLKKHNLFTEDALNLLFYNDVLDLIDYREAIDALPFYKESINHRRKKLDTTRADKISPGLVKALKWRYAPYTILDDIGQYGLILRQRNYYVPINEVIKRLNLKETYSRASIYRLLKKFNIKVMYSTAYIKTECLEMLITAGVNRELGYKKGINVSRATYYRYKNKYLIKTERKNTNREDIQSLSF